MCNWPHLTQRGLLKEKACVPQRRMDSMLIGVPMPLMGILRAKIFWKISVCLQSGEVEYSVLLLKIIIVGGLKIWGAARWSRSRLQDDKRFYDLDDVGAPDDSARIVVFF
ncbi:uncharacterized protein LOC115483403 isoform X2 [Drosophila hydei]|uniref:Uncharacterized protein LOC115483403 isoform X2 n=1 Tax=Drosophila hydei TaxID=7224 RepID=A0A6J2SV77_DROHY|nr:uncharacterized protein LOC115483403 isoform X2 [Drosophila hydei]